MLTPEAFPETHITYTRVPDRTLTLKPTTVEEVAQSNFWPLAPEVNQFLTESDQHTVGSPEVICRGPLPLGEEEPSIVAGMYVTKQRESRLIGIGFIMIPERAYPGIGQYILDPEMVGKGYGSLVIHGLSRHILDVLQKPVVQATTLEVNKPSRNSLAHAGFFRVPIKNTIQGRNYGPTAIQYSLLSQWLLYKPGDYALPEGKFQNPPQDKIDASKQRYLARNELFTIER